MKIIVAPSRKQLMQVSTEAALKRLESLGDVVRNNTDTEWTEEELIAQVGDAEAILTSWRSPKVTETILNAAPRLRFLGHAGGSIKLQYSQRVFEKELVVVNGASIIAKSVAEYTLGQMLSSLRKFNVYSQAVQAGGWRWEVSRDWEPSLYGRKIGLVGFGDVAMRLVSLLQPFECRVHVYDPFLTQTEAEKYGVHLAPNLVDLLGEAEILSLHCGVNEQTHHLLNRETLAVLKPGTILINTANGRLIDEAALLDIVEEKNLQVVLDVFSQEPLTAENPLRTNPRIVCTPHIAGGTRDERVALFDHVIAGLVQFQSGQIGVGIRAEDLVKLA